MHDHPEANVTDELRPVSPAASAPRRREGRAPTPAEAYESYSVPALFAPLAQLLVEAARPQPGDRLVDVACGTGIVLRQAASHVGPQGRLDGVDVNPDMVSVARGTVDHEGLTAVFHEAPAEALPFADASADLVLCGAGLMFFPDRVAALSEMRRVVVPDGAVAVSVLQDISRHPFYAALFDAIQDHLGLESFSGPFVLGDEDELRRLFSAAGFASVRVDQGSFTARFAEPERFLTAAVNTASAGIPQLQRLPAEARDELITAVSGRMEDRVHAATVDEHVVLPMHAHIVRATPTSTPRWPVGG